MNARIPSRWQRGLRTGAAALVCFACATAAVAQEPLEQAKVSYAAAAYEQALRLLGTLDGPEAQQYRALCFLALGRAQEAARVVESLVASAPLFSPSPEEVPPRFLTLVADTRRKVLPAAARRAFAEGREHFNAKAHQDAMRSFDVVLTLASDPLLKDSPDAQDLRTLASGFADLAKAALSQQSMLAVRRDPSPPALPVTPPEVTQATAINQDVPPLPGNLTRTAGPVAIVRVAIGADGRVTSASVEQSAHPRYDAMLLNAAYEWIYKPGMVGGRPVASERLITIRLQ